MRAAPTRRQMLGVIAGAAACMGGVRPSAAQETRITKLIGEASALPTVARRIDFISRALLGTPYRSYTLIGGPREAEQLVTRDDCFDCVTFCETVLAAARVFRPADYAAALRQIRYRDGAIDWRERNHYWSDWSEANVANGVCRSVAVPGAVPLAKTLSYMPELGPREMALRAVPAGVLLAQAERLATGDIIGFLSQRPRLDYFHTGFIVVGENGTLMLRHAAKSRGRVLDERLDRFVAKNGVRRVTLLRPQEPWVESSIV
ncbi:MAG: N-acetylmuramoyl-L-alanine amidase-like domain-containing protein [Pseudolabrys sp.]